MGTVEWNDISRTFSITGDSYRLEFNVSGLMPCNTLEQFLIDGSPLQFRSHHAKLVISMVACSNTELVVVQHDSTITAYPVASLKYLRTAVAKMYKQFAVHVPAAGPAAGLWQR